MSIFLRTKKTGNSVLLAKKSIDMSAFSETVLKTEVYVGLDTSLYVVRTGMNIDWSKAKQLVLEDANDTVFHYTVWLLIGSSSITRTLIIRISSFSLITL